MSLSAGVVRSVCIGGTLSLRLPIALTSHAFRGLIPGSGNDRKRVLISFAKKYAAAVVHRSNRPTDDRLGDIGNISPKRAEGIRKGRRQLFPQKSGKKFSIAAGAISIRPNGWQMAYVPGF